MSETSVLWEETVEPGAAWSHVLKRGTSLLHHRYGRRRQCRRNLLQL